MRVLISGASGFIGQHVSSALAKAGHEVIGLDARVPDGDGWGLQDFAEADITSPLKPISGLDAVIHLAAIANPRACDTDPTRAFAVNVAGTRHVLQMALESGARKVVFASTAHVYGISPRYLPTDESHPLWLQNNYTISKILGEQLCQLYWENHGLSYTTLRLFNAYGPGQGNGYFIPDMLARAREGAIALKGGYTTKDWVSINDVAQAFVRAVESDFVGPVNIGTGKQTAIGFIAATIAEGLGAEFSGSNYSDGATRMQADITRAKRVLGWVPKVTLTEGLRAVINAAKAEPVRS